MSHCRCIKVCGHIESRVYECHSTLIPPAFSRNFSVEAAMCLTLSGRLLNATLRWDIWLDIPTERSPWISWMPSRSRSVRWSLRHMLSVSPRRRVSEEVYRLVWDACCGWSCSGSCLWDPWACGGGVHGWCLRSGRVENGSGTGQPEHDFSYLRNGNGSGTYPE